MQSSLIGKIEKAQRYAQEKERVTFTELAVKFRGENDDYTISYKDGRWHCSCGFFAGRGLCSHTMALEKILGDMLPAEALTTQFDAPIKL
ncbi:MAG: SWIM zinc finger family protein [Dehalococcoidales bacterium]|nr:SWIM zinc finger family protein [Dehalococcoidales bacterium]